MKFNPWTCAKCEKGMDKEDLTELFGWGQYVCTPCIDKFLQKDEAIPTPSESKQLPSHEDHETLGSYHRRSLLDVLHFQKE